MSGAEKQLERLRSLQFRSAEGDAQGKTAVPFRPERSSLSPAASEARMRPAFLYVGLGLLAGLVLATGAYLIWAPPSAVEPTPANARDLAGSSTAPVGGLVASGYVVARRRATIASEITGRLTTISVEEGDRVSRGQTLAILDSTIARADAANRSAAAGSVSAGISGARAALQEAESDLARTEALAERGFATKASLDQARSKVARASSDLDASRANLASARASVSAAQSVVEKHRVTAPFSGIVTNLNAQVGEIISPMSAGGGFTRTGICTIVDMDSLEIEVDVNEASIGRVAVGQPVVATLNAYPDFNIDGRVKAIIPTADRQRSSIRVRIALDETDPRILPDMAVKVQFKGETKAT